jgi:hypothetical protein
MEDLLCRGPAESGAEPTSDAEPASDDHLLDPVGHGKDPVPVGRAAYRCRMDANRDSDARRHRASPDEAGRRRLERDWQLPMNERLARVHALCKQMTAIAGAARRK